MLRRTTIATLSLGLTAAVLAAVQSGGPTDAAPAAEKPHRRAGFTEADKAGFGTSYTRQSKAWFTLQGGRVSEVFYPDLSTPSLRTLELTVTDGGSTDRQGRDMTSVVTRPDERSLRFTQVSTDKDGRYRVTQEVVTDPARSAVVIQASVESLDGGQHTLGVRYEPALGNGAAGDRLRSSKHALTAVDRKARVASTLVSSPALRSAGRQAADIGATTATISLGFGRTPRSSSKTARTALTQPWSTIAAAYDAGWHDYLATLKPVPASAAAIERQYLASALVLAAGEDKRNPGAFVASPSMPWVWGDEVKDLSYPSASYHEVWSRDLYQIGTALYAMGDTAAARRAVRWLFETQQKKDGSFPQNSDVDGHEEWAELQLDQVTLPIALAHLVGKTDKRTYQGIKKAVRFLMGFRDDESHKKAPYSPQERWENQSGYSPATIAAQIDGLVTGAAIARQHGDKFLAKQWERTADRWARKVKRWTVTTNGPLSDAPYFLRVTKDGKPDKGTKYAIGDGGPARADQRRVVDPSFLDLVRFGILAPSDPVVLNSLAVVDQDLASSTPNGTFWHRFSFDGYGETRTGAQWDISEDGERRTLGRAWPLLAGERGEYAVAAGQSGAAYLASVAAAASGSDMIAEQVWDGRPPTGDPCCPAGEGTRSATPLLWSHAVLVRLAWTIQNGRPVDLQQVVADRYLG
ncbi:glycoside hydrolase family 15 protein [Nocardioides halotolerans]|uniref:glycoside hydrolase family 15 protein n=1 Tax=Nocardioides halotolerans TaxID=433660 RepID=UPI0006873FEC|nr:glycoside hydrolase family 15 protein [Nocardioides halotolerans]